MSLSQLLETLSSGGVDDTSEEEEAVVKVWFRPTFDGNAMLTCKKIIQKLLPQTFLTGLRAQCCCSSSHSCVPWLSAWRQVQWASLAAITQLLEGGSSLSIPCHPSSHVQSHVQRTLYCQIVHSSHQHYFP